MRFCIFPIITSFAFLTSCSDSDTEAYPQAGSAHSHDWALTNVNPAKAKKIINNNPNVGILDVRTPAEFEEGHIKGAINVDFKAPDFAEQLAKVDNHKAYILHCRSGRRSSSAIPLLRKNNFRTIYHLDKGFNAWTKAKMPVER